MPKIKPSVKIEDLPSEHNQLVLLLIREFTKPLTREFGIDATEEMFIKAIDLGILQILYFKDGEDSFFGLNLYNNITDEYVPVTK